MVTLIKSLVYKAILFAAFSPGGETYRPSDAMLLDPVFLSTTKEFCREREIAVSFYFLEYDLATNKREYERLLEREVVLRDCPPLLDEKRIPSGEYCYELRGFLRGMKDHLQATLSVVRDKDHVLQLCHEIEKASDCYNLFQQVHWTSQWDPYEARVLLRTIREVMGWDEYYRGEWPTPFPAGTLWSID